MLTLLLACVSMTLQDLLGTFLTIAETRGRAVLAGAMDAGGDLAKQFVTIFAAGTVIKHGWTTHSMLILAAVMATSFFGTTVWTRLGQRIKAIDPEVEALKARIAALEAR